MPHRRRCSLVLPVLVTTLLGALAGCKFDPKGSVDALCSGPSCPSPVGGDAGLGPTVGTPDAPVTATPQGDGGGVIGGDVGGGQPTGGDGGTMG
jgi:hypothetical protein